MKPIIKVIIPAFNEQDAIANVVNEIPKIVDEIIVVSNNSTDNTELNAKNAGATVLKEHRKGYGFACLKGMDYIRNQKILPEIIVFLDGDYSDYPAQLIEIIDPIKKVANQFPNTCCGVIAPVSLNLFTRDPITKSMSSFIIGSMISINCAG